MNLVVSERFGILSFMGAPLKNGSIFVTPWTGAHQDPLSIVFSRQEQRSVLPFPSPGDLPNPGIEPRSPASSWADTLPSEPPGWYYKEFLSGGLI